MNLNGLSDLVAEAQEFVLKNDRGVYAGYFEAAEKFCSERRIIIGGTTGVNLLLKKPLTKDSYVWDLYCDNTFENAKALADTLYAVNNPHVDNRTISMQTNIRYREFTISIDARYAFKIFTMDMYRDVKLSEVMKPLSVKGYFNNDVLVLPEPIVLIEIYQRLYSPAKCALWPEYLQLEKAVYEEFTGSKEDEEITGGASFDKSAAEEILVRKLLTNERIVTVGDHAISLLGIGKASRIQLITDIPITELAEMTSRVLSDERNALRRVKVGHDRCSWVKYGLNIPSDFQILKYTVYAVVGGEQFALFDAYNSTTYELIPYVVKNNIRIAGLYVLLRFLFIDIWTLKLIIGVGGASLQGRITSLLKLVDSVRSLIPTTTDLFQLSDYAGVNTSDVVAKKKLIAGKGFRPGNYYPASQSSTINKK